jgi:tetratricopeptide (TPR) repeat protein
MCSRHAIFRAQTLSNLGRYEGALKAIDEFAPVQEAAVGARHPNVLATRYLRARTLSDLGRYEEALKAIDEFAPVQEAALGARHPNVLTTRSLRLGIDIAAGKDVDHSDELRSLVEVLSSESNATYVLRARYRLARALLRCGARIEASREVEAVIASFHSATSPTHRLLRSCRALQRQIVGEEVTESLEV